MNHTGLISFLCKSIPGKPAKTRYTNEKQFEVFQPFEGWVSYTPLTGTDYASQSEAESVLFKY